MLRQLFSMHTGTDWWSRSQKLLPYLDLYNEFHSLTNNEIALPPHRYGCSSSLDNCCEEIVFVELIVNTHFLPQFYGEIAYSGTQIS
jgi:hypothetical protein